MLGQRVKRVYAGLYKKTEMNGWSWAGLVVARLSMGVLEGKKQEHDVDLQCMQCSVSRRSASPQQAHLIFLCLPPLDGFGWLMVESRIPGVSSLCLDRHGMALICY